MLPAARLERAAGRRSNLPCPYPGSPPHEASAVDYHFESEPRQAASASRAGIAARSAFV